MSRLVPPGRALLFSILPLVLGLGVAAAASNVVPASKASRRTQTITVNGVKPSACSGLTLAGITTGSGTFNDGGGSNLVLGSAGVDTIRGMGGNDCILGGAGNDSLRGDGGTDVCIGGGGTDTFHSSCETQLQ
jgi:RTX calcium-binding nonapeptide repeat (4 copies)